MGWCCATMIFDAIVGTLLDPEKPSERTVEAVIRKLIIELEGRDWDCQQDSKYANHPVVEKIFKELHPRWYDNDD